MISSRRIVQLGFLGLTITGVFLVQGNAEKWCPFGGVEAIYTYLQEGNIVCSLGVSNFFLLGGVLLSALLLRRAFCAYACPIGTVSECLGGAATALGVEAAKIPPRINRALSLFKYVVLACILYFTWRAGELVFRGFDPCYALVGRHGEDITFWAYVVSGAIVLGSLLITIPFCRWLCPLAAVLNVFSRFGLSRIRRSRHACINCEKCANACPMDIPVHAMDEVLAPRCTSCMNCIDACPKKDEGALFWSFPGRGLPVPVFTSRGRARTILIFILLITLGGAVSAYYVFPLPSFVWSRGEEPGKTAIMTLRMENLSCRGRASLLVYYLERDDELELKGYIRLEAWPGPGKAETRMTYDPSRLDETAIKMAITEPYYDSDARIWRASPFKIEGYDPLKL